MSQGTTKTLDRHTNKVNDKQRLARNASIVHCHRGLVGRTLISLSGNCHTFLGTFPCTLPIYFF